jgi:hypothetical protein
MRGESYDKLVLNGILPKFERRGASAQYSTLWASVMMWLVGGVTSVAEEMLIHEG